jgi:hypothetical protein
MKLNYGYIGSTVALAMLLALSAQPVRAATLTITRTDDPPPDGCQLGDCSLREAIIAANTHAGPDDITIPADTFTLSIPNVNVGENAAAMGDLDITGPLAITGAGAGATIIQAGTAIGDGVDRVFEILNGAVVTIIGVTVQYGVGAFGGGGIANGNGTLTLSDSVIRDNRSDDGGGISNNYPSTLSLIRTTIRGNEATDGNGWGIRSIGMVTLTDSTVSMNLALLGGGIFNDDSTANADSTATLVNSMISGNQATAGGGGLFNGGTTSLHNVTIASNTADQDNDGTGSGGGIFNSAGDTLTLIDTLVGDNMDNSGYAPDCTGTLASEGYNLIENSTHCTITGNTSGNVTHLDPQLGFLRDNGGPTETQALLGRAGVNGGNPVVCTDANGQPLTTDQRGVHRPQGSRCDIGAFKRQQAALIFLPIVVR